MARDLLNNLSDWALAPIFVGVSVLAALAGLMLVRRFLPDWRRAESGDKVVGVGTMVITVFALVLAFVIVNLNNNYNNASGNVTSEASSLSELVQDARSFPVAEQRRIGRAVAMYVVEVHDREFASLQHGREDPVAQERLFGVYASLQRYSPVTAAQSTFYRSAAEQLNTVMRERENRIEAAETSIPAPLVALMVLLAIITVATTILIASHHRGVDVALIVGVAVVVGASLLTAVILEYPFSGSIAVKNTAFQSGALAQLVDQYR